MLPHFIVRPGSTDALAFTYDFEAGSTRISRVAPDGEGLSVVPLTTVEQLLRHPAATADTWLAAVMPVREFGEPAFVETWSWDPVERIEQARIPHDKFGLMNMAASSDGDLVLVDRAFRETGVLNEALLLHRPTMEVRGTIHPMISTLVAAAFDPSKERLALIHVDQGGCEARLYRIDGPEPALLGEFAQKQLPTDYKTGALAFVDDTIVVWTLDVGMITSELVVYDAKGPTPSFDTLASFSIEPEEEPDFDAYEMVLSNANPAFAIVDGAAFIGGQKLVHRVPLDGTQPTALAVSLDVVVQIRAVGDQLLAIDNASNFELFTP